MISVPRTRRLAVLLVPLLSAGLLLPWFGHGQEELRHCDSAEVIDQLAGRVQLNVPLPGVTTTIRCESSAGGARTYNVLEAKPGEELSTYLRGFYVYFVWVVGILAAVMVMYAGIRWITAAGNSSQIENAKTTMNGAIIGLVLTLTSYLILQVINPELVRLRVPNVVPVATKFAGGFCTTINGIDWQERATQGGFECGQVFQASDVATQQTATCMSQWCPDSEYESCINCTREERPYRSCKQAGVTCGYYESYVQITGTVTNPAPVPLKEVALHGVFVSGGGGVFVTEGVELVKTKSEDGFGNGASYTLSPNGPVSLGRFFIRLYFKNGERRTCDLKKADGTFDDFRLTPRQGYTVSRVVNIDAQQMYNNCETHA